MMTIKNHMVYAIVLEMVVLLPLFCPTILPASEIPSPEQFLGYHVGADFHLAPWDSIVIYFEQLGAASDRIQVEQFGETTLGKPMISAAISSPENLANLDKLLAQQQKIADPRLIETAAEEQQLIEKSKPVVFLNCQLHATETGASQMSMELAYNLAKGQTPKVREILNNTIIVIIPCANPDGQQMVVEYYNRTLGTPWEGSAMPWLYHKYSGHDNNRDWFMLNLKETRAETRILYNKWFPTVLWDIHQTRPFGFRLFVPPFHDPKNPNMHPINERMLYVAGGQMAAALTAEGKTGVVHRARYDNWWAGGFRTTPQRHNVLGLLTEAASVNIASPMFWKKEDLKPSGRGMDVYGMTVAFPDPWPGGWWRLRNIVEYEKTAAMALFTFAARYHDVLQQNYIKMGRDALAKGKDEPPFAWIIPAHQKDPAAAYQMLDRLRDTAIEVHQAQKDFMVDDVSYPKGSFILYCAQPYRPHLMDMMERQAYPNRSIYPGGPAEPPYDVAGWTFPLLMGVNAVAAKNPFEADTVLLDNIPYPQTQITNRKKRTFLLQPGSSDDFRLLNRLWAKGKSIKIYSQNKNWIIGGASVPAGSFIVSPLKDITNGLAVKLTGISKPDNKISSALVPVRRPRIAVYHPWTGLIDEGWMRYVLDDFDFAYETIHNSDVQAGDLNERFDCIILASMSSEVIMNGRTKDTTFPEYVGGIGQQGLSALQDFVAAGGTLICNDGSSNFAIEHFHLPLKNIVKGLDSKDFYCPGSILRLGIDNTHPLGFGMNGRFQGYFTNSQAFEMVDTADSTDEVFLPPKPVIVSRFAETALLESGWIRGEEKIAGKPAIVEVGYGKGHIDLFGIRIQNRAQTHGTFRILFNAILNSVLW